MMMFMRAIDSNQLYQSYFTFDAEARGAGVTDQHSK